MHYTPCAWSLNRIQGKSMLENKSSQIVRDYMISYVGFLRDERIIAHVIVERFQVWIAGEKSGDNNVTYMTTPALNTSQRDMPMLGIERRSARWHGWVVTRMPTTFLKLCLACLNDCNFCNSRKLPTFLRTKSTIAGPMTLLFRWPNQPLNFKWSAFDVHLSFPS